MLNTAVFSAFGTAVTRVTHGQNEGVTNAEVTKREQTQSLNKSVTHVTRVTPQNNNAWDEEDWQCAFDERAAILDILRQFLRTRAVQFLGQFLHPFRT